MNQAIENSMVIGAADAYEKGIELTPADERRMDAIEADRVEELSSDPEWVMDFLVSATDAMDMYKFTVAFSFGDKQGMIDELYPLMLDAAQRQAEADAPHIFVREREE
jgi:hypothetical protein